jgi:porin
MILKKSNIIFIILMLSLTSNLLSEDNRQGQYTINAYNPFLSWGVSIGCEYFGELWTLENSNNLDIYNTNQLNGLFNFDLDEMFGLESTKIGITTISNFGKDPNEDFNSQQGITNIGALSATKFLQFYLEKGFWENRVNLTFGLLDINTEFDVKYSAKNFINPSHGIGIDWSQSGWNGPSIFPNTSLGARLKFLHKGNIIVQFAVLDGVPGDTSDQTSTHIILNENDGLLLCGNIYHITGEQIHTLPEHKPDAAFEHIGIGFWYYTKTYNHVFSELTNWGMYFVFEQDAFIESGTTQGLSFFGRFGIADDEINSVDYFIGLGFVYKGLFGGRDDDLIGFSIANAHNSYLHRSINALGTNELNTEFFYSFVVSDFLTLQLDLQTFKLADSQQNSRHTPVGGLRAKLTI